MRILIIASYAPSLINFRGSLLHALTSLGHQVSVSAQFRGIEHSDTLQKLKSIGVRTNSVSFDRGGLNPIADMLCLLRLLVVIRKCEPDCILAYTVKPIVYAGLAMQIHGLLRRRRPIHFVALITGLGFAFTQGDAGVFRSALRYFMQYLYRASLRSAGSIIFQNPDDMAEFCSMNLLPANARVERIWGSGVDLKLFTPQPLPEQPIFLLLARLLADKGIREYICAARLVKVIFPSALFRLAGMLDTNPSSITRDELNQWISEGVIEYLGDLSSVQPALAACRFYVLPSYREGTPRSVLEAMATGRPILTTNAPGCRETVIDGVNGFLVPPRNSEALANAMLRLIEQPESETHRMAQASLNLARERFDVHKVNTQLLEAMGA